MLYMIPLYSALNNLRKKIEPRRKDMNGKLQRIPVEDFPPVKESPYKAKAKSKVTKAKKWIEGRVWIILPLVLFMWIFTMVAFGIRIGTAIDYNSSMYSVQEKISSLKKAHKSYLQMTPEELHSKWLELYHNCQYQVGGDGLANRFDCLRSVMNFLKQAGGNIEIADIPTLVNQFQKMSELKQVRIRTGRDIKTCDIIIFKPIQADGRSYYHMGIVENVVNGYIKYMDVNAAVGCDFPKVRIGDWSVLMVVEPSYFWWIGDLLRKL